MKQYCLTFLKRGLLAASGGPLILAMMYLEYLLIYLLNNWIPRDWALIGVFTLCFAVGYALIWGIILLSIRHRTNRINRHLRGEK